MTFTLEQVAKAIEAQRGNWDHDCQCSKDEYALDRLSEDLAALLPASEHDNFLRLAGAR